jgi:hypothetical protein
MWSSLSRTERDEATPQPRAFSELFESPLDPPTEGQPRINHVNCTVLLRLPVSEFPLLPVVSKATTTRTATQNSQQSSLLFPRIPKDPLKSSVHYKAQKQEVTEAQKSREYVGDTDVSIHHVTVLSNCFFHQDCARTSDQS